MWGHELAVTLWAMRNGKEADGGPQVASTTAFCTRLHKALGGVWQNNANDVFNVG